MSFSNPIVGGTTLIREAIHSPDYVPGVSGWSINKDGTAEFNNVTSRGEVYVGGSNGSYIRIFADSGQAEMLMMPPPVVGQSIAPASLGAFSIGLDNPTTVLIGPTITGPSGVDSGQLAIGPNITTGKAFASLLAEEVEVGANAVGAECILSSDYVTILNDKLRDSLEHEYHRGEVGSLLISFTALDAATVSVTFDQPFSAAPFVRTNINAGSAATARWQSRAINATTTGFTFFVYASTAGLTSTWSNVSCSWAASEYTP